MPNFSALWQRRKKLALHPLYRGSGIPLHLLVDSTGLEVRGEGDWHVRDHDDEKRRFRWEIHRAVDEATLAVRAVEIADNGAGDGLVLSDVVIQITEEEPIVSVSADGACDTRSRRDAIVHRGADAVITPGETPSRGRGTALAQEQGPRLSAPASASVAPSSSVEASITAAAGRDEDDLHGVARPDARG